MWTLGANNARKLQQIEKLLDCWNLQMISAQERLLAAKRIWDLIMAAKISPSKKQQSLGRKQGIGEPVA